MKKCTTTILFVLDICSSIEGDTLYTVLHDQCCILINEITNVITIML